MEIVFPLLSHGAKSFFGFLVIATSVYHLGTFLFGQSQMKYFLVLPDTVLRCQWSVANSSRWQYLMENPVVPLLIFTMEPELQQQQQLVNDNDNDHNEDEDWQRQHRPAKTKT